MRRETKQQLALLTGQSREELDATFELLPGDVRAELREAGAIKGEDATEEAVHIVSRAAREELERLYRSEE